jgi:hypothetical protein
MALAVSLIHQDSKAGRLAKFSSRGLRDSMSNTIAIALASLLEANFLEF